MFTAPLRHSGDMSFLRRISFPRPSRALSEEPVAGSNAPDLTKAVKVDQRRGSGEFADIYDGWLTVKGSKQKKRVAMKKVRIMLNDEDKIAEVSFSMPDNLRFKPLI